MKRWRNIVMIVVAVLYFPVMFSFVAVDKSKVICGDVVASICDSVENQFVTTSEIRDIILGKYPGILGRHIEELDCNKIESFLMKHPAISHCEVYLTYGGTLHLDVSQREPLVRVFDKSDSYYLDMEGEKMPLFKKHSAHVLVANGYVRRLAKNELMGIAKMIHEDEFWKAQIEQVYVNQKGELTMVPRVGDHTIEFGSVNDAVAKFRKLKALYKSGWNSREWNVYKKVSLKYNGQVVCSKG
ncbi:MAG: cell division protein FtsQ [Carboxylicivirga sp.]|nr:cell division protein FtsQ [Carboxylicivirga sp.]